MERDEDDELAEEVEKALAYVRPLPGDRVRLLEDYMVPDSRIFLRRGMLGTMGERKSTALELAWVEWDAFWDKEEGQQPVPMKMLSKIEGGRQRGRL